VSLFIPEINDETLRQLPKTAGAYVLVIELEADLTLQNKRFAGTILPKGTYLYCGSANGPGDELTSNGAGRVVSVLVVPGGDECELRARLQDQSKPVPVPGFGSSDCTLCLSHLLRLRSEGSSLSRSSNYS